MRPFKDRLTLKSVASLLPLLLLWSISSVSLAAQYKLYINKQQSSSNVIIFEDNMSATVTHTNEGMELTLPGVEVALRCKSTDSNSTTDTCVIAIEQATTASSSGGTTTTSGGTTTTSGGTTTTSGGSDSGDCVVTTWNNCSDSTSGGTTSGGTTSGGTTSGGTTSGGTTSGGTTSGGTTSGGSGSCVLTGSVTCGSLDYGSGGNDATGKTSRIVLEPGKTLALPFTVAQGANYGQVGIVPTSYGLPDDGSAVRLWWSAEAGGKPLESSWCARNLGFEGGAFWDQAGKLGYGCPIPDANAKYFLNLRLCISSYSDTSCSASGARDGTQSTYIYIQGNEA